MKKSALLVMVILLGLTASAMIFRQPLAERVMMAGMERFNEHAQAKMSVGSFALDGPFGFSFGKIALKPVRIPPETSAAGTRFGRPRGCILISGF